VEGGSKEKKLVLHKMDLKIRRNISEFLILTGTSTYFDAAFT